MESSWLPYFLDGVGDSREGQSNELHKNKSFEYKEQVLFDIGTCDSLSRLRRLNSAIQPTGQLLGHDSSPRDWTATFPWCDHRSYMPMNMQLDAYRIRQ